jgi:hypothetical protein
LADGSRDGGFFVEDDEDLGGRLGLRGQDERGEGGEQEWEEGADIYTVAALVN